MRLISILFLSLLPIFAYANTTLNCWSGGSLIYKGAGELGFDQGVFLLKESRSGRYIIANADCIISTDEIK